MTDAILVTGGTGFVGLNVVEVLAGAGRRVVAFGNVPPPERAVRAFAALPGEVIWADGDILDVKSLDDAIATHSVTRILHGAIVTAGPAREASAPGAILEVNAVGLANVMRAAHRLGVGRVVMVGSVACFGRTSETTCVLEEDAPQDPVTLYAISKAMGERVLARLGDLYGIETAVGRLGAVYGPWEYSTGLRDMLSPIHIVTSHARAGENVALARPDRRDWIYARDAGRALANLVTAGSLAHAAYNLGTGRAFALADWCAELAKRIPGFAFKVGEQPAPGFVPIEHHFKADRAILSSARYAAEFGPITTTSVSETMDDLFAWYAAG